MAQQPADWQRHHADVAALTDWNITARMAIQTEQQGGTLDVFWKQHAGRFDIRMVAPLGQGAVQLSGDSTRVDARFGNGERVTGNPDALLRQHFAVQIPVQALTYWLRGIALDADYSDASWDEQGNLHLLRQLGWRVEMREYQQVGELQLPRRFYLELEQDENTNLRFIIRRWQVGQG